jgi:hypothetical protein
MSLDQYCALYEELLEREDSKRGVAEPVKS